MSDDDGRCRFNCRTNKEAFLAGAKAAFPSWVDVDPNGPKEAWHEYKQSNTRREGIRKTHETSEPKDIY